MTVTRPKSNDQPIHKRLEAQRLDGFMALMPEWAVDGETARPDQVIIVPGDRIALLDSDLRPAPKPLTELAKVGLDTVQIQFDVPPDLPASRWGAAIRWGVYRGDTALRLEWTSKPLRVKPGDALTVKVRQLV